MATYLELVDLVASPKFRDRIQYALWSVSVDALNDSNASTAAKNFARKKLRGSAENDELLRLAINCAANPTIAAAGNACSDSDIRFVVAGTFADLVA
jgi:hypothetical protein